MKALIVLACLLGGAAGAAAQPPPAAEPFTTTRKEPRSMLLAVAGATIAAGGFAILEGRDPCCCFPQPTPHQVAGGVTLVGIGAGLLVYGTQLRWVTRVVPAPSISRHGVGVVWRVGR